MPIAERHIQTYLCVRPQRYGWVVIYCASALSPEERRDALHKHGITVKVIHLFIKRSAEPLDSAYDAPVGKWVGGQLETCPVFDSYDEAVAAANEFEYVRDLPPEEKRVVKIKLKTTVELQEDRPVDVLDALAEAR